MNTAVYEFSSVCREERRNYIFQAVKGRRLTAIYHAHDFYELITVVRGSAVQTVNEQEVECPEHTVMLLFPGDRHCFRWQSDDIEIVSLSVKREEFELLSGIYGITFPKGPISFTSPRTWRICDLCKENRRMEECDCKLLLATILHAYLRASESVAADLPEALLTAAEEMKKAENLKRGIPAFVQGSNYSHSHLARLVKKHFGMGLKEYINEMRLRRAYDELVFTDESAEAIAEALGFSSYSHFYRIFKERFSASPSAVRRGEQGGLLL